MLWKQIGQIKNARTVSAPDGNGPFYLLPTPPVVGLAQSFWMVGEYRHLTKFASGLRESKDGRDFVTDHGIRLGLRKTDQPPVSAKQQRAHGPFVGGANAAVSFFQKRLRKLADRIDGDPASSNRRTDREENVRTFWETRTPQSHHVVEFNQLETIGYSREGAAAEGDYQRLPCVLLAAELHMEYVTKVLLALRGWSKAQMQSRLGDEYQALYARRSPLFEPLWTVSKIILQEAGAKVPPG